jgi:hypothetical protein
MTGPRREFPGREYDDWKTTDSSDAEPNPYERYANTEPDSDYEPEDRDDEYAPLFTFVGWEWMQ